MIMMISHRPDQIYILCVCCTLLMFTTSIVNIIYILRRSLNQSAQVSIETTTTTTMILLVPSMNRSEVTSRRFDPFEQTYKRFLNSFMENYLSASERQNLTVNYCPPVPPTLLGPMIIPDLPKNFSLLANSSYFPHVKLGGLSQPSHCLARHKVALIVPYRNRWEILEHFLFHIHRILQRQQLDYRIFVCEQALNNTFNKGIVMNACFKEILKLQPETPCFIMHDVDLLLIDDRNMYTCPKHPRHLSVAIDKFQFYLPYKELVGGVLAMPRDDFLLVNGYSTNYWGWGGEDDDMYARIVSKNLTLERPPVSVARYKMLKHTHQTLNPARMKFLRAAQTRIDSDGVNNVKYRLLKTSLFHLYTHFLIDVGEPPSSPSK